MELINKRILITGGYGFLGNALFNRLKFKYQEVFRFTKQEYNLLKMEDIERLFSIFKPQIVIHCAASLGNIEFIQKNQGVVFFNNTLMNLLIMQKSFEHNIDKFVMIGSASEYPENIKQPFNENDLWEGLPGGLLQAYGFSKKIQIIHQKSLNNQYGFDSIHLILGNLYGPGYDIKSSSLHVVPDAIRKLNNAKVNKETSVSFWGSGKQMREFLYISDAIDAIEFAIKKYNSIEPLNIGSSEIALSNLINIIKNEIDYMGEIRWDNLKPEGVCRRKLDDSKFRNLYKKFENTSIEKGIKKTIRFYKYNEGAIGEI